MGLRSVHFPFNSNKKKIFASRTMNDRRSFLSLYGNWQYTSVEGFRKYGTLQFGYYNNETFLIHINNTLNTRIA